MIVSWLHSVLMADPPREGIVAFNVRLFEVEDGFCAYLAGAPAYSETTYCPVPKAVGSPNNDSPELVEPIEEAR